MDDAWLIELQGRVDKIEREIAEGVRPRLHKLADGLTIMQLEVKEITVLSAVMREELRHLRDTTATRTQVDAGVETMSTKLEKFHAENSLRIDNLTTELAPIKRAMWWAVFFLASGVGAAVLNLVLIHR